MKIIRNRAQCNKCKEIIESLFRHDFVMCKCGSIYVDGGLDYHRRGGEIEYINDLSEWEE